MNEPLKPCPFCGAAPKLEVCAYYYPPGHFISGRIYCPNCKADTNNPITKLEPQVEQSVFWTDDEILKHVANGLALSSEASRFHPTTAKAAKAAAREKIVALWQRRTY